MRVGVAVERGGGPAGVLTDAADAGEPAPGERVLATLPPGVGVPDDVPGAADRGFDSDALRDGPAGVGFRLPAPHRRSRERPGRNDGRRVRRYRRRCIVERTVGWLHSYRRLPVRHEFYAHLFDGFLHLACALIAVGKI